MARPAINKDLAWFMARGRRMPSGCLEWVGKVNFCGSWNRQPN